MRARKFAGNEPDVANINSLIGTGKAFEETFLALHEPTQRLCDGALKERVAADRKDAIGILCSR